ncbi:MULTISPECIES: hypothetical protein [Brevibacillus]|jgi:hypothetical protein|nr:hypothetical protein [Brevibacillus borstelensis]MBE5394406.1 hypothetical protein [Brevibacillus borstelensis]MCC0564126.1 hypothetical protein [Brevibacillus borstelensis]MCM3470756.1 hypothetical protein [Brevibacillus borstelensis]MCM3558902.1 hypothetical protein [Brevibacillus borstelensis]MCM3592281.1 hypothetical protein [Brevibacillus borstelensis]
MDQQQNNDKDVSVELQQVGAYPTKQTMHEKEVPLLEEQKCDCCSTES